MVTQQGDMQSILPYEQNIINKHVYAEFINPNRANVASNNENFQIVFQFPPKILNDAKGITWNKQPQASYEPIAIFMGSTARAIKLKFEYVVVGDWDVKKIYDQINNIKAHAYFGVVGGLSGTTESVRRAEQGNLPYMRLVMYNIIPRGESGMAEMSTWRVENISITYSPEMTNTIDNMVWPVHTEVNLDLEMITQNNKHIHLVDREDLDAMAKAKEEALTEEEKEAALAVMSNSIPKNPQGIWY